MDQDFLTATARNTRGVGCRPKCCHEAGQLRGANGRHGAAGAVLLPFLVLLLFLILPVLFLLLLVLVAPPLRSVLLLPTFAPFNHLWQFVIDPVFSCCSKWSICFVEHKLLISKTRLEDNLRSGPDPDQRGYDYCTLVPQKATEKGQKSFKNTLICWRFLFDPPAGWQCEALASLFFPSLFRGPWLD